MRTIGKFRKAIARVCAVCIGVLIVDAAYSKGKYDAYKECHDIVVEGIAELDSVITEEEAE